MLSKSSIKYIQSLQQKKFREEHRCFIAEGPKVVAELLAENTFSCRGVYATESFLDPAILSSIPYYEVSEIELERISGLKTPNKVLAVFEMRDTILPVAAGSLTLVLDDVQDPGNVGTLIRIADWFGIKNIVCSEATADIYNPKVVQSSMASLARVNVTYTDIVQWLIEQKGVKKYAAALQGRSLKEVGSIKEGIVIIGNESGGIKPEIMELADEKIIIRGMGKAESLNAAVAAGIILYAITS